MKKQKVALLFPIILAASVVACNSGSSGTTASGGNNTTRSVGTVTRSANDVYVNGTQYDATNATVTIDGQSADASALQTGMVVTVDGETDDDNTSGTAVEISYDHELKGAIDNIMLPDKLSVMGQTVLVDAATQYVGKTLDQLAIGDAVEVSGFADSDGAIHASFVEYDATPDEIDDVKGTVSGLDATGSTFKLKGLTVDYRAAEVSGELADGVYVEAQGDVAAGTTIMAAKRVEVKDADEESAGHTGEMEIEGYVNKAAGDTFEVNGQSVKVGAQTVYSAGKSLADVVLNAKVEVEGTVDDAGVLQAAEVSFE